MDIEIGKTYYCPTPEYLVKVIKEVEGVRVWDKTIRQYLVDILHMTSGDAYRKRIVPEDSILFSDCVLLKEEPDKAPIFDKAKKAYDTYMATISAIEQQVKDNINKQIK